MSIKALIVDDEPIAHQIIEQYVSLLHEIEIVGNCTSALDAKRWLQTKKADLIFLDINMPVFDGLSFLKTLSNPPLIIFTTAYKEYAHEAFDLYACDYLLKPFSLERFIISIDKAREKLEAKTKPFDFQVTDTFTYVKSEGRIYKVDFNEVLFAEADGNYVKLHTITGLIRPAITLSSLEEQLPAPLFIRLHRSFIVNKKHIGHIDGNRVFIGGKEIPIGSNYRERFLKQLGLK